jgi:hypothetical protein
MFIAKSACLPIDLDILNAAPCRAVLVLIEHFHHLESRLGECSLTGQNRTRMTQVL